MAYFITGGTGFIGRFFIEQLLRERQGKIYVLTRPQSRARFAALCEGLSGSAGRLVCIEGDITQPLLGMGDEDLATLGDERVHVYHFAAIYDLAVDAEAQRGANIDGTRNAVELAARIGAAGFHHVSSIAAAGLYKGTFREDMFAEAEHLEHPYFATKHEAESVVRKECRIPWRIYRPSMVVGDSRTGEIDKIDGVYYTFKSLQKLRRLLPPWFPLIGLEGGKFNIVPVDYVVAAMDHISHREGLDGQCFHLTDPRHHSLGELLNIFADAGHAPRFNMRLDSSLLAFIPKFVRDTVSSMPAARRVIDTLLADAGMPRSMTLFLNYPTHFDNRNAERALEDSDIRCPELREYANVIWDYWERRLDPDLFIDRSLQGNVAGKSVLVTGASSGIGYQVAVRLADAGARVLLVARDTEKLEEAAATVRSRGGEADIFAADLSDLGACDKLAEAVLTQHGHVDILVNSAGRSIRRSLEASYDRFHDFERTMQINYFGAVRLTMALLPRMTARRQGHVINISSIGTLGPCPRFAAYVASKSALDAWTDAASVEYSDHGIHFTTIHMPLVRTPMIKATSIYDSMPMLSADQAADLVVDAVINRPRRIATRLGVLQRVCSALTPRFSEVVMGSIFHMFRDSAAARGDQAGGRESISNEQAALAALMQGLHF
ncbi:SDR family oxidoreductase [Mangrovimicrobium sediminis]|uniref:SDR family oxidoreductase n=1 Tax=Mangrovimicrobium sediminis TaxID=2562682 RepID=A0A4Z0M3H7_9GAMM|nr:SDR family oxidoreductase [Haliea sp. SAOS-164]TGD73918.1 SDR family oxidoreductase [Haliea sp. SAOS-164]